MKNEIVRAEHEHLEILTALFDAYRVFYEQPTDPAAARAFLQERMSNLESVIFLALDGEEGLGFVQLYPQFASVSLGRMWLLYDLYVVPEARRQGIGRALMEHAADFARATGAIALELATAVDNRPAQALYESLGWVRDVDFYRYELDLARHAPTPDP